MHWRCVGMIVCASIAHCLCDGIGTSQFLNVWADTCRDSTSPLSVPPCWGRETPKPRHPPHIDFHHGPKITQPEPESGIAVIARDLRNR
ncbi:hypothetical protein EJ110_NYTH29747 [Nymphaea thermarum]|nr:hypothetical protein EJ110_NYTH29747 [Nymphaea thermarum]